MLSVLTLLDVSSNRLHGEVSATLLLGASLLQRLYLKSNVLNGAFPPTLLAMSSLMNVSLGDNYFTGEVWVLVSAAVVAAALCDIGRWHEPSYIAIIVAVFMLTSVLLSGVVEASAVSKFGAASFAGSCFSSPVPDQESPCEDPNAERAVLIELFATTGGVTTWTAVDHWNTDWDVCEWYGVTCDDGRVRYDASHSYQFSVRL